MARRTILLDTLTRHFITFAKTMGFFPKLVLNFRERSKWDGVDFYRKKSYYDYIERKIVCSGVTRRVLTESTIRSIYFDDLYPRDNIFVTNALKYGESIKESEMLIDLFVSYLKDKKIPRYIRILI